MPPESTFDIRNFAHQLTQVKEPYICPNCGKPKPSIEQNSSQHQCFCGEDTKAIAQTAAWIERLGLSVMPECPIEAAKVWGEKSAKRPCFWDEKKQLLVAVSWKPYQDKRPTQAEKSVWFASPKTQVGCLGGWNGKHWLAWIDFDRQHFESKEALEAKLLEWEGKYPVMAEAPKFGSPSGGYRYLIAFEHKPDKFGGNSPFTLISGDSTRMGEILTNNGGHTLLPPTQSFNGVYQWERWSEYPPVVEAPSEIGLYPVTKKKSDPHPLPPAPQRRTSYTPGAINLDKLLCPSALNVLQKGAKKGNRSDAIAALANEVFGWVNWLNENGVSFNGNPTELIQYAWSVSEDANCDSDKWKRIIKKIECDISLVPAAFSQGNDKACWLKIRSADRATYEQNCPTHIKDEIRASQKEYTMQATRQEGKVEARQSGSLGNNSPKPVKPISRSQGNTNSGDSNGGGNGTNDSGFGGFSGDELPNIWNAPSSWKGELGWWHVKEVKNNSHLDDDESGEISELKTFIPKCNFDFQIEQELSSVDKEDGGGLVLQVKRSIDSEQKRVIIKSVDYGSAKDFETALKKALGDGIVVNLKSDQLKSLIHVRLREYRQRGGRKYRLADRIGQQEDGTWVFENKQFTRDGQPTTQEESGWVYNPQVSPTDTFASPEILDEDPKALRNLIEAQKKVAGSNFMRFLLCDGYVAACLNEQAIVKLENFMPILNPYGDPGGGKTVAIGSALSLAWGTSDKSGMCSASESYLYERLRRYGSIPTLWDDPPSKRREDKEKLDELIKRNYGKFARKVRGSDQKPYSSFIPTTNHSTGDVLPASKSRGINLFFPVTGDLNFEYHPELEDAKAKATGAFRQIISIGYNRIQVREVRARLQKYLPTAHDRAAIHLAILTWYTQKVVDQAGVELDVENWVIKNLCPELNEAQTGLNSIADFVERFMAARSTSALGAWNFSLVKTAEQGNCLAIHMPSVWSVIERGDPPPYNRSVLERVLVEKGAIKNKPAKLDRDRDSTLAYQREIHKGRNEGEGWIPPTKPKPVNKKCILIPERLWGDLGFLLLVPDSPPDGDGGGDLGLVTSSNGEVTSSNQESVTSYNQDSSRLWDHSNSTGNLVTKKYREEEKKEIESVTQIDTHNEQWNDSPQVCEEKNPDPLQKEETKLPDTVEEPEILENTGVEVVTTEGYSEVTQPKKEVTQEVTQLDFSAVKSQTNVERSDWTASHSQAELTQESETTASVIPAGELTGWMECHTAKAYPNPKSDNIQSSQKRSLAIRKAIQAARCREDLSPIRRENGGQYNKGEILFVLNWLRAFFPIEHRHYEEICKVDQASLF